MNTDLHNIADELTSLGGFLRCESCGRYEPLAGVLPGPEPLASCPCGTSAVAPPGR